MGHRMEICCDPEVSAAIIAISEKFGVSGRVVGRTEFQETGVSLAIVTPSETIEYQRISSE